MSIHLTFDNGPASPKRERGEQLTKKKMSNLKCEMSNGFTLVELILATTVASIVGGLLIMLLVNSTGLFFQQSSRVTQGVGLNDSMSRISSSIKEAKAVASGYPAGSSPTYTSGTTQLVIQIPSIDSSGNIIGSTYDYDVYFVDQSRLMFKRFPDAASKRQSANQVLTGNVNSVKFDYFDSAGLSVTPTVAVKVRATLTLKQKAGYSNETNVATSEANLRND